MNTPTSTPDPRPLPDLVLVHDDSYAGWVFHTSHPTQGRRFLNGRNQILTGAAAQGLAVETVAPRPATRAELERVHTADYVRTVLDDHACDEWAGQRPDLSALAALFAGGTLMALEALLSGVTRTAVHLPGAKHHAQADRSSGFCVLADFALAATVASERGLRVAVLDVDAHHGDGTESLTADLSEVCTVSIHQAGIFPGTGLGSDPDRHVHNLPLGAGAGDVGLLVATQDALRLMKRIQPDLILLAAGADGHVDDPLSSLGYTTVGYRAVARLLREAFPSTPVLIGGAGGYRPDDATPEVWAAVAVEVAAGAQGAPGTVPVASGDTHGAGTHDAGMSQAELTRQIASITRREQNRAKAPEIAAALRTALPGVTVTDKVGMFGAAELWLMVDGAQVGSLASNHLWLATEHMHAVTDLLGGQILPLDAESRRWRGWIRVKFAESHDGVVGRTRPAPAICPTHFEAMPMTGNCDRCADRAA